MKMEAQNTKSYGMQQKLQEEVYREKPTLRNK